MNISVDTEALNQLNTAEARRLFETIVSLSARGVGKIVDLPQIIVVGEQSSGKSSVLEAISRVRFPVQHGVCTRFATELVLRHAEVTRVDISVKFADSSKSAKSFQKTGFEENDLPDLIREAKELMGYSEDSRKFSKDVLRLEIEGPEMYPLTLVDLPGLFHTETADQTLEGMEIVNELVDSYMRQKNSIILTVITADQELANHAALHRVKEHDPSRERTIGVITKPDVNRTGSMAQKYVQVARNEEAAHILKLGWHVLRNRAENEPDLDKRDAIEEAFFSSGAWNSIVPEDRGIVSLRKKLRKVLFRHIGKSLPGVVAEIQKKYEERLEELDKLGKSRDTVEKKRSFLIDVANKFQRLARDATEGRYKHAFFGSMSDENRKLRAQLRNFNRVFDYILTVKGAARVIGRPGSLLRDYFIPSPPTYLQKFLQQYPYPFPNPKQVKWEDLNTELQEQASINQGSELPGLPNKDLAIQLFRSQAEPWEKIAKHHLNQVIITTKVFVDELFTYIMGPPESGNATEAVLRDCVDPFFRSKEKILQDKLQELLRPYVQGYAFPLDADFHRNASQKSLQRLTDRFVDALQKSHPGLFDEESTQSINRFTISAAMFGKEDVDGGEFGTEKVIEMMESYYEMSRRTFAETVINLAIESCLICDIPDILSPMKVDSMVREKLEKLAVEPEDVQYRRKNFEKEIEILRQGKELCQELAPRTITAHNMSVLHGQPTPESTLATTSSTSSTIPANAVTLDLHSGSLLDNETTQNSSTSSVFGSKTAQKPPTSNIFGADPKVAAPPPLRSRGSGLFSLNQLEKASSGSSGSGFSSSGSGLFGSNQLEKASSGSSGSGFSSSGSGLFGSNQLEKASSGSSGSGFSSSGSGLFGSNQLEKASSGSSGSGFSSSRSGLFGSNQVEKAPSGSSGNSFGGLGGNGFRAFRSGESNFST